MKASKSVFITFSVLFMVTPLIAGAVTITAPPAATFTVTGALDIVANAVNWFFTLLVILAVLALLYGAFLFLTAGGDEKKTGTARSWLLWALVGFAVALLARGLLTFVCSILNVSCPSVF